MKRTSLRLRFATWTSLAILGILIAFGAYVYFSLSSSLYISFDDALSVSASQISASLNVDNGHLTLPENLYESPEEGGNIPEGFSARILSPEGQILKQTGVNADILPAINPTGLAPYYEDITSGTLRMLTTPVMDNEQLVAYIQVAQSTSDLHQTLDRLLAILFIAGPLSVLIAGISGYFLAARALHPIDEMTETARMISAQDLSVRLEVKSNDELGRLGTTFNQMLERIDNSFERERQFTADASHELRTPLAAMQAILSVIQQRDRKPIEYRDALKDLDEEVQYLRNLAESLLVLARQDQQSINVNDCIDLSDLLEDIVESMRPLADEKNLALQLEVAKHLQVKGDRDALIRLFINLIDNAFKYTPNGSINISANKIENQIYIEVSDSGIGISDEHLPHIFERFYRADTSRSQRGTGLGLALALQIAQVHGGNISVQSQPGKGSTFCVTLPQTSC